jgi:hypothetical protein
MKKNDKHIVVTGSHRSGTTWMGKTISQHAKIKYIQEPFNVTHPNKEINLKLNTWFTHYPSSTQQDDIKNTFDRLFAPSSFSNRIIRIYRRIMSGGLPPKKLIKCLYTDFMQYQILVKDPIALLSAGWLYDTYDINVICMIRSPLGFVSSLRKLGWDFDFKDIRQQKELMGTTLKPFASDINNIIENDSTFIDRACLFWNILHFVIVKYTKKYPLWLFVNYDKLALNPLAGFDMVFNHLKLDMGSNIKNYINHFTSDENPAEANSSTYKPRNSKRSLENWK